MANSKIETRTASKIGMVIRYCVSVVGSPPSPTTKHPFSQSDQEKHHSGRRTLRAGKALCRVIIVISIGIWIAWILLWTACLSLELNGCVQTTRTRYMCVATHPLPAVYRAETWARNQNGAFRSNMLGSLKSPNPANGTTVTLKLCRATTLLQRSKRFWLTKSPSTGGGTESPSE